MSATGIAIHQNLAWLAQGRRIGKNSPRKRLDQSLHADLQSGPLVVAKKIWTLFRPCVRSFH